MVTLELTWFEAKKVAQLVADRYLDALEGIAAAEAAAAVAADREDREADLVYPKTRLELAAADRAADCGHALFWLEPLWGKVARWWRG
jgi:hypothetical protein